MLPWQIFTPNIENEKTGQRPCYMKIDPTQRCRKYWQKTKDLTARRVTFSATQKWFVVAVVDYAIQIFVLLITRDASSQTDGNNFSKHYPVSKSIFQRPKKYILIARLIFYSVVFEMLTLDFKPSMKHKFKWEYEIEKKKKSPQILGKLPKGFTKVIFFPSFFLFFS